MYRLLIFGVVFTMVASCSQDGSDNVSFENSRFFPLSLNSYIEYQVNELVFRSEGNIRDTFTYQLREEVADTYVNDLGETIYLIDRSTRSTETQNWEYLNTSQAYISENLIIRVDDNIPFVKLEMPIRSGQVWNGNQFFDASGGQTIGGESIDYFKEWNYKVLSDDSQLTLHNESFDAVLEISLADFENKIEIRRAKEWYAPNIGLIKKILFIADTQCFNNCENTPWEVKGEKGHIYTQEIINYN